MKLFATLVVVIIVGIHVLLIEMLQLIGLHSVLKTLFLIIWMKLAFSAWNLIKLAHIVWDLLESGLLVGPWRRLHHLLLQRLVAPGLLMHIGLIVCLELILVQ